MKGEREVSWSGVNVIFDSVHEMERDREMEAALLNDVWHSVMIKAGCVSSRIIWIKFKFSRVKVCVVVGYGPNVEGEERDMDSTLDNVGNEYRL